MVKCAALKPCWCVGRIILVVVCGRMIFSRVFAMGESRAIGLYEEGRGVFVGFGDGDDFGGFPYLGYGVCVACDVVEFG